MKYIKAQNKQNKYIKAQNKIHKSTKQKTLSTKQKQNNLTLLTYYTYCAQYV